MHRRPLFQGKRKQLEVGAELVLGDPFLCKFVLVHAPEDAGVSEPPEERAAPLVAPRASQQPDAAAPAVDPEPASVVTDVTVVSAEALTQSREAIRDLEADVGTSVDVWRARVSAQAAAAAAAAAPAGGSAAAQPTAVQSGAWRGKGLLGGFSALIQNSQVLIQNSVTVNVGTGGAAAVPLAEAKAQLVRALLGLDGGARATAAQHLKVEGLCRTLEAASPATAPLRSPLLGGRWTLQYASDAAAPAAGRLPGLRPVSTSLTLDVFALKLLREEAFAPLPFLRWNAASVADVVPRSDSRAALRYRGFRLGGVDLPAPPRSPSRAALSAEAALLGAEGEAWFEVRYLDYDLQIQRSSAGQLAVLTRAE